MKYANVSLSPLTRQTDIVSQNPPPFPSFLFLYGLEGCCFCPLQLVNVCVTVAGLGFAAMYHMSHYYLICSVHLHGLV